MKHCETLASITVDEVAKELTSRAFLTAFSTEIGVTTKSMALSKTDRSDRASLVWMFSTDRSGIPTIARKFLGDEVQLSWEQVWTPGPGGKTYDGELNVNLDGRPSAQISGICRLESATAGVILTTSTTTKTSLPRLVATSVETSIDHELVGWILEVQVRVLRRRLNLG